MPCGSSDSRRRAEHRSALLRTRICRRCSGEGSASYSLHISRPPGRRDSGRFYGGVSKNAPSSVAGTLPGRECAHSGHPRPLSICAGVTSHSCPHFRNRNRVFSSAFTYGPTMITSSLRDFSSSTTPRGISAWFPRTWDSRGRATGYPRPAPTPNRIRRILRQPGRGSFRMFRRP